MTKQKVILLNGSPRKSKTSYSFARTIKQLLEQAGHQAEILHVIDYYDGRQNLHDLQVVLAASDLICLVSPLYFDTAPAPVIWLFEQLAAGMATELKGKNFFAVGQCGFPDNTLLQPLLSSAHFFAQAVGLNWLGGIAYGGGSIIDGAELEHLGKKGRQMTAGFQLIVDAALGGQPLPAKAQQLLTVKIPKFAYPLLAAFLNSRSRKIARSMGVTNLLDPVYLKDQKS